MELPDQADEITSYEELSDFIFALEQDLRSGEKRWENDDLRFYLNAMSRWVGSVRQLHRNLGEPLPEQPTWQFIADMLRVAANYE